MAIKPEYVQNEILSIINEFGLRGNVRSYPAAVGKNDFFRVFYHKMIKDLMTSGGIDKKVLIYKAPCDYAADIMLRFPVNDYIYLHSSYRELERFQRDYREIFDVKKQIILTTGENMPGLKRFSTVLGFENDFEQNRSIAESIHKILKNGGYLFSFREGDYNFKTINEMIEEIKPKPETRGRKPLKKETFQITSLFSHEEAREWKNSVNFTELRFFLYFLFKYLSDNGYSIYDYIDYFAEKVCALYKDGEGFTFNAHYVLDIFRAE